MLFSAARVLKSFSPFSSSITRSDLKFALKFLLCLDIAMNPFSHTGLSLSDSLKSVRKSVLIYETIIHCGSRLDMSPLPDVQPLCQITRFPCSVTLVSIISKLQFLECGIFIYTNIIYTTVPAYQFPLMKNTLPFKNIIRKNQQIIFHS